MSGNVEELAGCWVQDPTATKCMLQPRVNLHTICNKEIRACCNNQYEEFYVGPLGGT